MSEVLKPDVLVIGAGPGGYVAAIRLAQFGKSVLVVERDQVGGTCLNWGCIPSKALIHGAHLYDRIRFEADEIGIQVGEIRVDLGKMVSWKDGVVKKLTGGIAQLFKAHGIQYLNGEARFTSPHQVQVRNLKDGSLQTVEPGQILIATGSTPAPLPGFPLDGAVILDSRDMLSLTEIPKRLAVIGGGVIGLEMACLFQKLGSKVTVIELFDQLLAGTDAEIAQTLQRALKKRKLSIKLSTRAKLVTSDDGSPATLALQAQGQEKTERLSVDKILVAVGRKPNTQGLGLQSAGIQTDERGFIQADAQLRTSVSHIYAIGDVIGGPLLAHKASKEGLIAAAVMAGKPEALDVRAMPAAVFTDPEVATVGLSEEAASKQGFKVKVGKFPFQASGRALSMNAGEGMVKLIADADTDQLLGVHLVGPHVSELIAEAALAIEMGATAEDLALTVHTHPTLPESLMEAAEALHGQAIHIYQPPEKPARKPVGAGASR